jgi:hypothetical protein
MHIRAAPAFAALGLALHYLNAFIITCIFFAVASGTGVGAEAAPGRRAVRNRRIPVINCVVVPLSRIGPRPTPPAPVWITGVFVLCSSSVYRSCGQPTVRSRGQLTPNGA